MPPVDATGGTFGRATHVFVRIRGLGPYVCRLPRRLSARGISGEEKLVFARVLLLFTVAYFW